MKCYVKDFSNSLDSNRERVAYTTFELFYLKKCCFNMETGLTRKRLFQMPPLFFHQINQYLQHCTVFQNDFCLKAKIYDLI